MKIKLLVLLSMFGAVWCAGAYGQTKRALIIAIGKYPEDSGWQEISSGWDDTLIQKTLRDQRFTDLKSTADNDATISGIKKSLDELISRSQRGDVVVIHISSHGERLEDAHGNKPDGLEESIVSFEGKLPPYGSEPTKEELIKFSEGYFRDDEFGSYVDKLRTKLGPKGDVVVFMDLCYAGTGTRGTAKVRGGRAPLVSQGFYTRQRQLTADNKQALALPDESTMSSYVVIGAARANEADNEMMDDNNHPVGPLSYAMSKVFTGLDSGVTYRGLFAKIQSVINEKLPGQHPVLTGNGQDRKLFAGSFVTQKPYIIIDKIKGTSLTLKAGKFSGLDSGARVAVYPAGTNNPVGGKLLAMGTVTRATLYNSDVTLDADPHLKEAALGWAFITSRSFKNNTVRVSIANNISHVTRGPLATAYSPNEAIIIRDALKGIPGVRLSSHPDINLARGIGTHVDSIIISATGKLFDTLTNSSKDTAALKNKIKNYARYNFLRSVNVEDPDDELEVRLIPVVNGSPDTTYVTKADSSFCAGDKVMVWVNNKSRRNLFINILDMQPNGIINPILPNSSQRIFADDLMVPSGSSYLFKNYVITMDPPYGKEIFKVFASADKIDLEDIALSHGAGKRGNLSPFETLLQKSFNLRSEAPQNLSNDNGTSYNIYFDITPKP